MKFLILFALIGAAFAEVTQEEQIQHEKELAELCQERGVFANPHDPEGRTFIRCELEPVELRCDEEFIFDAEKLMCVEKPQPPAPEPVDLDAVVWADVLTCPDVEDKYFRNPYDCSRFYRCYKQGHISRLDVGTCVKDMIFDEVIETCLPAEQFRSYYGHACENAPLVLNKPEVPEDPLPQIPEVPEDQEIPEVPEVPEVPEDQELPEAPEVPEDQELPEAPEVPEVPEDQELPEAPEVPEVPEGQENPEVPEVPEDQELPEAPEVPEVPEGQENPETPEELEQVPEEKQEQPKPSLKDILKSIEELFKN